MSTKIIKIDPEFPELELIEQCADIMRKGGIAIFPTDTVYGIGACINQPKVLEKLAEIKNRDKAKPFACLLSEQHEIFKYTDSNNPQLYKLISKYWPGPLTLVVPYKGEDQSTLGIRMPAHVVALDLLRDLACLVATSSANKKDNPAPTNFSDAIKDFDGIVDVALDAGDAFVKKGSSVVDITSKEMKILREDALSKEDIAQTANRKCILFVCTGNSCRSVMAEYALKHRLKDDDEDIEVISAGTSVFMRSRASDAAVEILRQEGIDAREHVSQPLDHIALRKADLIFAMTQEHRNCILNYAPEVEERLYLLKEFVDTNNANLDVPDPVGMNLDAYSDCLNIINQAIDKIITLIKN